jgi:hypothetical protein
MSRFDTLCRVVRRTMPIATVLAASTAGAADWAYDPALAKAPPEVQSATVELLAKPVAAGNAVLRVRFVDRRRQTTLVIQGGAGPAPLRDDGVAPDDKAGDGSYAGWVGINPDQLRREQLRRVALAQRVKTVPVFKLREFRGLADFRPSPATALVPGVAQAIDKFNGVPITVDPARELLVRHTLVVEDPARTWDPCTGVGTPMGAWTFGRLMTEMANQPVTGIDPSDFVENWVRQFMDVHTINTFNVWPRPGAQDLIDLWPKLPDGRLDLAQSPFRLLAIVNRQDLRGNLVYGGSGDAGEARLVFGAVKCSGINDGKLTFGSQSVLQFTVIFEYGVPRSSCPEIRSWAQQWHALGTMVIGSAAYNAALQAITDQFTLRDANSAKLPNRSAINQVRTNEFALASAPVDALWDLRESKLVPGGLGSGQLRLATVAQTPDASMRVGAGALRLRDFINGHEADLLAGTHIVPLSYPAGTPFRGGQAEPGAGTAWTTAGILNTEARQKFSIATCNGCHTLETDTRFLHIAPRATGAESQLSDFLTGAGMPKTDPVSGVPRSFNELLDRQMKLDATASMTCFKVAELAPHELFFVPLPPAFAH